MRYQVKKIRMKDELELCNLFEVANYMWDSKMSPKVYGRMGYLENKGLYVKMYCEEVNPKREFHNHRDPVYQDSTMEVFLAFPEKDEALSNNVMYTNFEMNANGAMYAAFGKGRKGRQFISDEMYELSGCHAEIEDDRWSVEVIFPESYLRSICDLDAMLAGGTFYCNFYKISESKEIEHYGSYSPIDSETPNFHLPVCFAEAVICD